MTKMNRKIKRDLTPIGMIKIKAYNDKGKVCLKKTLLIIKPSKYDRPNINLFGYHIGKRTSPVKLQLGVYEFIIKEE